MMVYVKLFLRKVCKFFNFFIFYFIFNFYFSCEGFVYPITNIPSSIKSLKFGDCYNSEMQLPPHLTHVNFGFFSVKHPPNYHCLLSHISLFEDHARAIDTILPPNLTHLSLSYIHSDNHLENLPPTLEHIELKDFNLPLDCLPPHVKHIVVGEYFNQPVDNLPPSLSHIHFGQSFNQPVTLPHLSLILLLAIPSPIS
jgi:FNIP Repeat